MTTEHKINPKTVALTAGFGLVVAAAAYTLFVRRWHNRWGATDEELTLPLPGDEIVENPNMSSTRAITIEAGPSDVWPWMVQMGKGRGGLYSYDWLDIAFQILDTKSVEEILDQYQRLEPGDTIPLGCDEETKDDLYVHAVDEKHSLVLGANDPEFRDRVSWAMVLIPAGPNKTRLLMRVRADIPLNAKGIITYAVLDPAAFLMVRKQMLNFKKLAEKTRRLREEHHTLAAAGV